MTSISTRTLPSTSPCPIQEVPADYSPLQTLSYKYVAWFCCGLPRDFLCSPIPHFASLVIRQICNHVYQPLRSIFWLKQVIAWHTFPKSSAQVCLNCSTSSVRNSNQNKETILHLP